jgi:lipopolysaccharide transport system permease protein
LNIIGYFELINAQAVMALKADASKLFFSYLWWVLEPLLFVIVFYVVFETLLHVGREDFLLFLVCGKIPFLWFSKSVTKASNSIVQNKGVINQVDVPKTIFPYVSVQESFYRQLVVFIILFGVVILYGNIPGLNWLWLLPVILTQYAVILLCSLVAALAVSYLADFRMIINMGMMFLLFASGIFWDLNRIDDPIKRELLLTYNPLAFLIDAYRQVLMYQSGYDLNHLIVLLLIVIALLLFMHNFMKVNSRKIASRVIAS